MIDGVHIWRAALDDPGWPGPGGLPADERERAASFLRRDAARRWVASRWALRRVLGRYLDQAPAEIELELGEHGKPRLRDDASPEFNLSHSEGVALVAVADRPIGVDIEAIRPDRDLRALAERALPAEDIAALAAAAESERSLVFHQAWARQEARLKCLGVGLSGPHDAPRLAIEDLEIGPDYAAAVAVLGGQVGTVLCRSLFAG